MDLSKIGKHMLVRKVWMIGDFGVGRTSSVQHYVHLVSSDRYLTAVVEKNSSCEQPSTDSRRLKRVPRDIAGSTAPSSAQTLHARAQEPLGPVPRLLEINEQGLSGDWKIGDTELAVQDSPDRPLLRCSGRTGENADAAFTRLAQMLAEHQA
jgi:hypothetical protein